MWKTKIEAQLLNPTGVFINGQPVQFQVVCDIEAYLIEEGEEDEERSQNT